MPGESTRRRVLVVAPSGRDGPLAKDLLERSEIEVVVCKDVMELCDAARLAVGASVIAEEALDARALHCLGELLSAQAAWSDLPLVFINNRRPGRRSPALERLLKTANVTTLDRPLRMSSFVSTVCSALRARRRQYDAEKAIMQRDTFLAMLSHELRNPLAAIILATELLEDTTNASDDSRRQLQLITRQSRHLTRLVDDLLDVSRVTTGKITLQRQPLSLDAALDNAMSTIAARDEHHRIDIVRHRRPLTIYGDTARIEQVLVNLLTNSLKYTPPPGRVSVTVDSVDDTAKLSVRDSGIGISAEMLPSIFDIFVQADGALARSQGGMGVGLTLAKSLVDLHGGRIEARSEGLGCGSEFIVYLPLLTTADAGAGTTTGRSSTALHKRNVLVIEDSEDLRDTMCMVLEKAGHTAQLASNGSHGLELLVTTRPDVAFIDLGLPGLDGYEVARRARRLVGESVMLVAVSGYGQAEDKIRAIEAGFDAHLTKPVDAGILLRTASAR